MPAWLVFVAAGLATFRLTRLVTEDDFPPVRAARTWVVNRKVEWLGDLVTCCWCASGWVALGLTVIAYAARLVPGSLTGAVIFWFGTWAVGALVADYWGDRQYDRQRRQD